MAATAGRFALAQVPPPPPARAHRKQPVAAACGLVQAPCPAGHCLRPAPVGWQRDRNNPRPWSPHQRLELVALPLPSLSSSGSRVANDLRPRQGGEQQDHRSPLCNQGVLLLNIQSAPLKPLLQHF